jgi:hypothetical protein
MSAKTLIGAEVKTIATDTLIVATAGTTVYDFGTPDDIYLPTYNSNLYKSTDKLLLVLTAVRASGTTDSIAWTVQDADDTDGGTTIGTPATAITDGGSLAAAKGDRAEIMGIELQAGRPWLRVSVVHSGGGSDSYSTSATLLAIPAAL